HAQENLSGRILHQRTGALARSVKATVIDDPKQVKIKVGTDVFYGRIQEKGTRRFGPRKRHFMRFEMGGRPVFARKVKIPARPWLKPALAAAGPEIQRALGARLEQYTVTGSFGSIARSATEALSG